MSASQATPQNWDEVRRGRLARSHLLKPAPKKRLVGVVRDTCGIHAQVLASAELALSARVKGITHADVRGELWERTLVKTWTMRGTLHLHPADELPMWAAAARAVGPPWYESYDLTAGQGEAVLEAIGDALDGRALLREELADEVVRRAGEWTRERIGSGWGFIIGSDVGKLCHGSPQGTKVTFVRTDQWSGWRDVDPEGVAGVPTLVVDGVVAGLWHRAKKGKRVEIAV